MPQTRLKLGLLFFTHLIRPENDKLLGPELAQEREEWIARYAAYRSHLQPDEKAYHFYPFVYVTIYRAMRKEMKVG